MSSNEWSQEAGRGSQHSAWSVPAGLRRGILFYMRVCLTEWRWLKSRKCLSVKMKELMGCSSVESVLRCPQHLWNSGHVSRLWKTIILWSTAKPLLYTTVTSVSSFYSPFPPLQAAHASLPSFFVPWKKKITCQERTPNAHKTSHTFTQLSRSVKAHLLKVLWS